MTQPPGWYPDPSGVGRRYWDGTQWGPEAPPPEFVARQTVQPKRSGCLKPIITTVFILACVVYFAATCSGGKKHTTSNSAGSSISSTAPATSTTAIAEVPRGTKFHTEPGSDGEILFADFKISDNFTPGLRTTQAQIDTVEILRYAQAKYPQAARVWVQGSFPMVDQYGNTSTDVILNVGYDRATLDKINFDGINPDNIWKIRDAGTIHPELR